MTSIIPWEVVYTRAESPIASPAFSSTESGRTTSPSAAGARPSEIQLLLPTAWSGSTHSSPSDGAPPDW